MIVVTLTSWSKRISSVGKMIYSFFSKQTVKPDVFYLWLSKEEFPNKESDLPKDLLLVCKNFDVKICWTETNEYNFKRWNVYPKHYDDLVISIDDDIVFPNTLVAEALKHKYESNRIYNIFKNLTYFYFKDGKLQSIRNSTTTILNNWISCSVVCPRSFPLQMFDSKYKDLHFKICKRCDETWNKPFSLLNNTPIGFLPFMFKRTTLCDNNPTFKIVLNKVIRGYTYRELQLFYVLDTFPELFKRFVETYPAYLSTFLDIQKIHKEFIKHKLSL
jgi:hypothetical protein